MFLLLHDKLVQLTKFLTNEPPPATVGNTVNPPLPPLLNTLLATPPTLIPATSPIAPLSIPKPSCLTPSLLKLFALRLC